MNSSPLEVFKIAVILGVNGGDALAWLFDGLGVERRSDIDSNTAFSQQTKSQDAPKIQNNTDRSSFTKKYDATGSRLISINPERKDILYYEKVRDLTRIDLEHVKEIEPATVRQDFGVDVVSTSLLEDRWIRAIFTEVLSVWYCANDIDTRALMRSYARTGLIHQIPFRMRRRFQRGVDILIDQSGSMGPFFRDVNIIIDRLHKLLGKSALHIYWFSIDKGGAVIGERFRVRESQRQGGYEAPVLLITDFGIGSSLTRDDAWPWIMWERSLKQFCRQVTQLVALIPASSSLWPEDLRRVAPMALEWERHTTPTIAARESRRLAKSRRSLRYG